MKHMLSEIFNFLLLCAMLYFGYWYFTKKKTKESAEEKMLLFTIKKTIESSGSFSHYHIMRGTKNDKFAAIAVDTKTYNTCIVYWGNSRNHLSLNPQFYSQDKIVSVEVFEDKEMTMTTSRKNQAAGMIIGNVLLGGVGAIVGGLSAKQNINDKINSIDLRITVDDLLNPIINCNFFTGSMKKSHKNYKELTENARYWHGIFSAIIHHQKINQS